MSLRMFSGNDKQTTESKELVLVAIINNEVELSITEPSGRVTGQILTLEDIDDLSDALLLARAYLVNISNQDTLPNNSKP